MRQHSISYPFGTQAQVRFFGYANDPLEPSLNSAIGAINWDMNAVIDDSTPTAPTAYVNYNHTWYPAHIVQVNGTTVYEYLPPHNNTVYLVNCLTEDPIYGRKVTGVSITRQVGSQ